MRQGLVSYRFDIFLLAHLFIRKPARRDLARNLLVASAVHARMAKASRAADDHRRRSTSSYEAGRQLLLALGGPGQISREDEELLREVGARVGLVPVKR